MEALIKVISENGVLIIIAAAFIWDKISHSKTVENVLKELQSCIKLQDSMLAAIRDESLNRSNVLTYMQSTVDNITGIVQRNDKRTENMSNDIRGICTILNTRPCISCITDKYPNNNLEGSKLEKN